MYVLLSKDEVKKLLDVTADMQVLFECYFTCKEGFT